MAAPGGNEIVPKLFTDVRNMHVQKIGESAVVLVEQMLVKNSASNHLAAMERQILNEGIFARGEGNGFACARNVAAGGIDDDVANFDSGAGLVCGAPDESAETSQ